ncbi:Response regulator PleD [Phycisphaerae bacterium RAS1]|nr:Response regulator PleD [Phycisphaerae bacterium RAS1]
MAGSARLLIIGPGSLHEAASRALPACSLLAARHALAGLWQLGQEPVDGILVGLNSSDRTLRAIRQMRTIAPKARIVVACRPVDEPRARNAIEQGADEYILEPITRGELEAAFALNGVDAADAGDTAIPAGERAYIAAFSELLKNLPEGSEFVVQRLAALLRQTFSATFASLQVDDLFAAAGEPEEPVLIENVRRQGEVVGCIKLGRSAQGAYSPTVAARLETYARMVELAIALVRRVERLQNEAWRDDLSGLRNRRFFEKALDEAVEAARENRTQITVLLFDIDEFKVYNDRLGHDAGDTVIREIGQLLTRCARGNDVVSRYGGDEFAVLFADAEPARVPGSRHPRAPIELAERFRRTIAAHPFTCLGPRAPGPVTISGGLACFPWDGSDRAGILRAADEALLCAKRTGKNRIELTGQSSVEASPQ